MKIGKYKINLERFANFVGGCLCVMALIGGFVFFFGFCYGGFMR